MNTSQLSLKQYCQLRALCKSTQSYLPHKGVTFLALMYTVRDISRYYAFTPDMLTERLKQFKDKYYPYGFKYNNRELSSEQIGFFRKRAQRPVFTPFALSPATDLEVVEFVMVMRACKNYIKAGMTDEAAMTLYHRMAAINHIHRDAV